MNHFLIVNSKSKFDDCSKLFDPVFIFFDFNNKFRETKKLIYLSTINYEDIESLHKKNYIFLLRNTNLSICLQMGTDGWDSKISKAISEENKEDFYNHIIKEPVSYIGKRNKDNSDIYIHKAELIPAQNKENLMLYIEKNENINTKQKVMNLFKKALAEINAEIIDDFTSIQEIDSIEQKESTDGDFYKIFTCVNITSKNNFIIQSITNPNLYLLNSYSDLGSQETLQKVINSMVSMHMSPIKICLQCARVFAASKLNDPGPFKNLIL